MSHADAGQREITGWKVLTCLVAFFGVVGGVNAIMIYFATSTFGGIETENAYRAGLAFNREVAAAGSQNARDWQVHAELVRLPSDQLRLDVRLQDASGVALQGIKLRARLVHPTAAHNDHVFEIAEVSSGKFRGEAMAEAGQWDLVIEAHHNGERLFRSKSRRILR